VTSGAAARDVLLVEDNPGDADLVLDLMARGRGNPAYRLVHTPTLAGALAQLGQQPVDAVLLDLHLPDGSGVHCVRALREVARELPIVVLTGHDGDELALQCIAAGAQDYLPKQGLHETALRRAIGHAVARTQEGVERRRADALQERLAAIVEGSHDAIVSCTVDGTITSWNHGAEQIFGHCAAEAIGRRVREIIRDPDAAGSEEFERRLFQTRKGAGPTGVEEVRRLRKDGRLVTLSVVSSALRDASGAVTGVAAICRDITESRRRDDELRRLVAAQAERERRMRALTARLNTLREEERTRISREVHDGLGQLLTGLKMDIRWMTRRLAAGAPPAALAQRLAETEVLVDQTIETVQRIAVELRPSALDALGLPAAIRDEARRFEARTGVRCVVQVEQAEAGPEVAPTVATALFRILQELLTNVARHAEASTLCISLGHEQGLCVLQVSDDGVGIGAQGEGASQAGGSLGLLGMAERAAAVGGTLSLARHPAGGTVATVKVPPAGA
jgi:two-component system sensor histidine kinase UhpB